MKLQDAMKKAVGMFGADVIGERRLFCILDDFLSFDEYPAMKQAMRVFSRRSIGRDLLCRGTEREGYLKSASEAKRSLAVSSAIRREFADYAIDCVSYALGHLESVDEPLDHGFDAAADLSRADEGDAYLQLIMGEKCFYGDGLPQDYAGALSWYRKAADQGDAGAEFCLGWMYENGIGGRQDNAEALKWYRKAAAQGNADAKERASALSRSAAGAQPVQNSPQQSSYVSHHVPEYERAEMYFYGRGVAQDYAEAVRLYSKAAAEGDDRACYSLGWMYQNGLGVLQSLSEAASWYRKAAEHGNTDAHSRLISLDQTPVSYTPERSAYDRPSGSSTPRGGSYDGPSDPAGQYALGDRFFYGRGVPQDYAEAFSWYGKAAGSGNADAMYSLGWMYQNGLGVRQSYSEAVRWYREAAANGNTDAVSRLRSLDSR